MAKHPRTSFFDRLERMRGSARSQGYRMPAEWEPMARVWLTPPYNDETWPGCLAKTQRQFRAFMKELAKTVEVTTTQGLKFPTNDSWIRDYGPIFVVKGVEGSRGRGAEGGRQDRQSKISSRKCLHDFRFNGWGGKYETRDKDDVIPQRIAKHLGVSIWLHDLVLEGGSIDVNGIGTVMTTEQCLLNKNRNPRKTRKQIIEEVHEALGTHHAIWLPGGIIGDDTDGHIDDIARFVNTTTIVGIRAPKGHQDFDMLDRNWKALQTARDQDGKKLTVVPLPVPEPIKYNFPPDRFGPGGVNPVPASYANFLIANEGVFVPVFGQKTDDAALRTLERVMPKHKIVPIRAEFLVVGLGALHCLSMQEPECH